MIWIGCAIVFVISILSMFHWRKMPLYADDGNFFYEAEFNVKRDISDIDYLGINNIAKLFRKIYPIKGLEAYYDLKIIWFSLTNVALFYLCQLFFCDYLLSFLIVGLHLIYQLQPINGYSITTGETFLLLPLLLGFISFYYAYQMNMLALYFITGVLVGYAYIIKVVAMIIILPLYLLSLFYIDKFGAIVIISGIITIAFIQVIFTKRKEKIKVFKALLNIHIAYYFITIKLYIEKFFGEKSIFPTVAADNYMSKKIKASPKTTIYHFKLTILPLIQTNFSIFMIAIATMIYALFSFDLQHAILLVTFIGFVLVLLIQNHICSVHFNHIWLPISVFAAMGIKMILSINNMYLYILIGLFMLPNIISIFKMIYQSKKKPAESFVNSPFDDNSLHLFYKNLGLEINKLSNPQDYVLLWSKFPVIYLYAQRRPFDRHYFFFYHGDKLLVEHKLPNLYSRMRYFPPRFLVFYKKTAKDHYTLEEVNKHIRLPYMHLKNYNVKTKDGKQLAPAECYIIDNIKMAEILFERFLNGYYQDEKTQAMDWHQNQEYNYENIVTDRLISFLDKEDIHCLINFDSTGHKSEITAYISIFNHIKNHEIENAEKILHEISDIKYYGLYYLALGELSFLKQDVNGAKTYLSKCIAVNPYLATAYNDLGVVYSHEINIPEAKKCFKKALECLEDYKEARENLSSL